MNKYKENKNPNARVKELKAHYGAGYNYRFLEMDNLQREFHFDLVNRDKEYKRKREKT